MTGQQQLLYPYAGCSPGCRPAADVATFAAAAQSYHMKPQMLGGGGRSFQNITFNDVPFASQGVEGGTTAWNINGKYASVMPLSTLNNSILLYIEISSH